MVKRRILVVEDEAMIAVVLAEVLEEMGFEVCGIEATEAGAIAAARRLQPDLLIVDARLKQGSGISAIAEILRSGFIAHVYISGDRLQQDKVHPRAVLLQKPFLESDLGRAIQQALGDAKVASVLH